MKKDLLFATALLMGMATTADAAKNKAGEIIDTLKARQLQEVQVLSTRANKKTPMAFTNVTKEAIKQVNYGKDVPYMLALTPSVTLTSDAGNGIGYTTLRVRGTDPSRINITANGIPMNDAESSSLYWVNFGDFASSAQSIQIQRGVGTSTNGSGAFGATVNFLTDNVGAKPYVGMDFAGGSYYSHKETIRFSTGLIDDHWGFQGRLSNIGSKGYLDRASTKLNSYFLQAGYFSDNTMVKFITFNGQEQTYHAWNYTSKYEQSLYGRTYNSCGLYTDVNGNRAYYDNQTDNYHSQNYQLIWSQRLTDLWNLNAALHYTRGDGYYEQYGRKNYADYGLNTIKMKDDIIYRKEMGNDFYGAIASVNYDNKSNLTANIGGGWNKYDGDHFGHVLWHKVNGDIARDNNFEYYRNNAQKTDFNVYGKATYEFIKGLNGFVDLQYRHVNLKMQDPTDSYLGSQFTSAYVINEKYDFFNPKVGVNYDINANNKVYVSYAISHKEPVRNNYEDWYNGVFSEKPKAERLNDLELGYKYQSSQFSAGANFYYMNYKNQFVLTGELNEIGEAITRNFDKSYRLGIELEAAWKPVEWFQWDANATWSQNRAKDMMVTLEDGETDVNLGDTRLSFSPDFIFNNILTFKYAGFQGSIQSQYISDQYLTNTGFKEMKCQDKDGNTTYETLLLKSHFNTNIDLSYHFSLKKIGMKDATIGVTLYNIFDAKYDNNGWAAPQYRQVDGKVIAVNTWNTRDQDAAGFAPSAPFNWMAHLSINF